MNWHGKELIQGDLCILEEDNLKVTMEWIGEGNSGDYDLDDPDDIPLIRFSCDRMDIPDEWTGIEDASYCTLLPYDSPRNTIRKAAGCIMDELRDAIEGGGSPKKPLEHLSWLCLDDFKD